LALLIATACPSEYFRHARDASPEAAEKSGRQAALGQAKVVASSSRPGLPEMAGWASSLPPGILALDPWLVTRVRNHMIRRHPRGQPRPFGSVHDLRRSRGGVNSRPKSDQVVRPGGSQIGSPRGDCRGHHRGHDLLEGLGFAAGAGRFGRPVEYDAAVRSADPGQGGEFYPFGATVITSGETWLLAGDLGREHPASVDVLSLLVDGSARTGLASGRPPFAPTSSSRSRTPSGSSLSTRMDTPWLF